MKKKKNDSANIERHKRSFFLLGMVISISLSLIAFEWNNTGPDYLKSEIISGDLQREADIINTFRKEKPKPEPPPPVAQEKFEIVENTEKIINEFNPGSLEITETEPIHIQLTDENTGEKDVPDFFVIVEDMPSFQGGGIDKFHKYVLTHLVYPALPQENGISGTVILSFIIDEQGELGNIEILRSAHPDLDREAIRVLSSSPDWIPGKQRGKPVKVKFTIPIKFSLQ